MSDHNESRFEYPTNATADSGVVIERITSADGAPSVRLAVVVAGLANRVVLTPREALGIACQLGGFAEIQGRRQNALASAMRPRVVEAMN